MKDLGIPLSEETERIYRELIGVTATLDFERGIFASCFAS